MNKIAYFCLEIALESSMKTYAGGLGVLAGDTLKSAADLGIEMVGLTLLYKQGYFKQIIDTEGNQKVEPDFWKYDQTLQLTNAPIQLELGFGKIWVQVWKYNIKGLQSNVPVYLLDVDLPQNDEAIRQLSYKLYGSDRHIRLRQEILLGIGGVNILQKLSYEFDQYHLNESHAAFTALPLIQNFGLKNAKTKLTFTTHTPVPAGHEHFDIEILKKELGDYFELIPNELIQGSNVSLNMSKLCFEVSHFANAVSKRHAQVTQEMFPNQQITYVTNGVHHNSWVSEPVAAVLDKYIPDWREEPSRLRMADIIPHQEVLKAHCQSKLELMQFLSNYAVDKIDPEIFTIGFARRAVGYKRSNLIFNDRDRLNRIASKHGKLQLIFSGKAYPGDSDAERVVEEIYQISKDMGDSLMVVYVPDYNIEISKKLVSGVDLWLNNPIVPQEASGTSGMKASLNGVPNFSTLDGWWVEGCVEGVTGWSVGDGCVGPECVKVELEDMYHKLEDIILPMYYNDKTAWAHIQRNCIGLNGSYFNTHRMLQEYILKAYQNN
ncbi:MAG: alpha-glucan family phosphorylase [Patescibacteria group bacterium]